MLGVAVSEHGLEAGVALLVKGTLNTILGEVEAAIYANRTLGGIARDMRVEQVDKNFSDELETRTGEAVITVNVDWSCLEGSPQTPL